MQNLSIKVAKIVGTPYHKRWSQVYSFSPEDDLKRQSRGELFAVLSYVLAEDDQEISALGREIIQRLHEEYYGETETPVLEKLSQSVKQLCEEFTTEKQQLEIVAAVLLENVLYLTVVGPGEVWVKRQDKLGRILQGLENGLQTASGFVQEDDLVILGTVSFYHLLGEGVLRASLESNNPDDAVEFITPLIHSQEATGQSAGLIGKVIKAEFVSSSEDDEVVVEEEIQPSLEVKELRPKPRLLSDLFAEIKQKASQTETRLTLYSQRVISEKQ